MRPKPQRPEPRRELDVDVDRDPAPPPVRRGPLRPERKGAPDLSLRRLAKRLSGTTDDIEQFDLDDPLAGVGMATDIPERYGKQRDRGLPRFLPNRILNLLAAVTEQTDADLLERRVFKLALFSTVVLLAGTVLAVVGVAFFFRARSIHENTTTTPSVIVPAKMPDAVEWEGKLGMARATIQRFFDADDPNEKRALILDGGREGEALRRHHAVTGGREAGRPRLDRAKASQAGDKMICLVPVETTDGMSRVAAVVETSQGFLVDWRSAVTPEPMKWSEFISRKPAEPQLFRVNISAAENSRGGGETANSSGWQVYRLKHPGGSDRLAAARAGSRVAEELDRRLAAAAGKPFGADVHLRFDPSRPPDSALEIAGVLPEKWNL